MRLAEKCADIFSRLKRNERSKTYYIKQVKIFHYLFTIKDGNFTIRKLILFS